MTRTQRLRALWVTAVLAAVALLTGCGGSSPSPAGNWVPKQDAPFAAEPGGPTAGPRAAPSQPGTPAPPPGATGPTPGRSAVTDPAVVATGLSAPTGVALLPDGTALVGERDTGRIVLVQPTAGQPTPVVETVPGLDTSGGGGLLDLAVSPTYPEDHLVFALISTATDQQVVTFAIGGPITPVVTGLPKMPGRMTFDATGHLLVAIGTAITRYDDIGRPAAGNPVAGLPGYAATSAAVAGMCLAAAFPAAPTGATVLVATASGDQVSVAPAGGASSAAITQAPAATPGMSDCAVVGQRLYVTTLAGQALLAADLGGTARRLTASALTATLTRRYGRLRTVVAAPDGALWLTTANRDGHGQPSPLDDRVIRIMPAGGGGHTSKI